MRRPDWAGTRTFSIAWNTAVECLPHPVYGPGYGVALKLMEPARVIVVPEVQVLALPQFEDTWEMASVLANERLPFDPLYIELGTIPGELLFTEPEGSVVFDVCALVLTEKHSLGIGPAVMGFIRNKTGLVTSKSIITTDGLMHFARKDGAQYELYTNTPTGDSELDDPASASVFGDLAARLLRFLNCINVDLMDAPIARQERRATERKGGRIAKIVYIRQNQKKNNPGSKSSVDWTHRWEVRGHYKHYPAGTQMADAAPEKLSWEPMRREYVRRLWCPPYVKGPADKPLIPKTHVVV